MILDDIDEMVETIKNTYAEMETMYAKYLPYFPMQGGIIDGLNQQLNALQGNADSMPRHDKEPGKELMNQKDMLTIADDVRRFRESQRTKPDGFTKVESSDRLQYTIRNLFRKINQLCHPDKTKKFNRVTVLKLRECFDDAQKAYEHRDYDTLELTLIRVYYYRDEVEKMDPKDVAKVRTQYENLKLDIKGLQMHRLYMVLWSHQQQLYQQATNHFGIFLQEHMDKLQAMIDQLTDTTDTLNDLKDAVEAIRKRNTDVDDPELMEYQSVGMSDEEIADDYDRWVAEDRDDE